MTPWVIDSSSLVTLGRAAATELLDEARVPVLTVHAVFRETVEVGRARGYPDAASIGSMFQRRAVRVRNPRRTERLAGISETDSLVIHLAEEVGASVCFINDQALRRKARNRG